MRLRDRLPSAAAVGGASAGGIDFRDLISGSMWKIVLFVLGLSYVVLLRPPALGRAAAEGGA